MVSSLLGRAGILAMEQILDARVAALGPMVSSVDGGAGWGATSGTLAQASRADGRVHAFEPFPGNHRFFADLDERIRLYPVAISATVGRTAFYVSRTVAAGDEWAGRGLEGYSSLGHITSRQGGAWRALKSRIRKLRGKSASDAQLLDVATTRLDTALDEDHLDFVKLDLQGGELDALRGMGSLLARTDLLWVEFTGQAGLLDFLLDSGFLLFDTNYLCPRLSNELLAQFHLAAARPIVLSTSQPALLATRTRDTGDFTAWFAHAKSSGVTLQTDLLAVNPGFIAGFLSLLGRLPSETPDPAT